MGKLFDRLGQLVYSVLACILLAGVAYIGLRLFGIDLFAGGKPYVSAQQAQMNIAIAQRDFILGIVWRSIFPLLVITGGLGAVYRFLYAPAANSRERVDYNTETGMTPVIVRDTTPLLDKIKIALGNEQLERKVFRHDANLAIVPTGYIRMNGKMTSEAHIEAGVTVEQQVAHSAGSWGVQNRVAGRSLNGASRNPNRAMLQAEAGVYDNQAKLLESKLLESQGRLNAPFDIVLPPVVLPELSLDQAIKDSLAHPGRLIVGTSLDGTQRYEVDFNETPFVLIGGKTRIGKTTTAAFQIVTAMLAWGWPVTVFEPSTKRDWELGFAGGYVNHHVVDTDNALKHVRMILAEYLRRDEMLKANRLRNWTDDPSVCPPWVVVLEELGSLRDKLKAENRLDAFDTALLELLKKAANTGLMIVAVDQYPNKYEPGMRGQFGKIAFYMGGTGLGTIMESPLNHKLVNLRGCFDVSVRDDYNQPVFFRAYHTQPYLGSLLARVPRVKPLALLTHVDCSAVSARLRVSSAELSRRAGNGQSSWEPSGTESGTAGNASLSHSSHVYDSESTPAGNAQERSGTVEGEGGVRVLTPPSVLRAFLRSQVPGNPQRRTLGVAQVTFAQGLLEALPTLSQSEFRTELRAAMMAMRDYTQSKETVGDMKSTTSRLWHAFSPLGDPEKLTTERPDLYAMAMEYRNERNRKKS